MKKHTGGITSYLNQTTQKVINTAAAINQLVDLDISLLETNESNFYGLREVESLAGMIATSGYINPLEVKSLETGKYKIISGHRRHAAISLLIRNGERIDPKIPCIVRDFEPKGPLSAEEIERCYLIFSNRGQRQYRTVSEKLEEIRLLEPIAHKIWEVERQTGNVEGNFRSYFAEELNMSSSALQRLLSLKKLIPEAMEAVDNRSISETAAAKLASLSPAEQKTYLDKLQAGEVTGTTRELSQTAENPATQNESSKIETIVDPDTVDAAPTQKEEEAMQEMCDDPKTSAESLSGVEESLENDGQEKLFSKPETISHEDPSPAPAYNEEPSRAEKVDKPSIQAQESKEAEAFVNEQNKVQEKSPLKSAAIPQFEDAEEEADSWVLQGLMGMLQQAIEMIASENSKGNKTAAAQWDVRRSKTALLMALLKE